MTALSQQNFIEGRDLSVTCQATPGNPSSTTFYWTKADNPGFKENGPTLRLYNIQRNSSGTYRCTAENNYNNGEKGTDSQAMIVNVQCEISILLLYSCNIELSQFVCIYNVLDKRSVFIMFYTSVMN